MKKDDSAPMDYPYTMFTPHALFAAQGGVHPITGRVPAHAKKTTG